MKNLLLACVVSIVCLAGCANADKDAQIPENSERLVPRQEYGTLAYEHRYVIEIEEQRVDEIVDSITSACIADIDNACKILSASVNAGEYASATVKLRIAPGGVEPIIQLAETLGTVSQIETLAEDLAEPVADFESRLKMLTSYLEKLHALEIKSDQNVDALIKIESEISRVQSEIEQVNGRLSFNKNRIKTEVVELKFVTSTPQGFWAPIGESFSDYSTNLAEGVSSAISGTALVLPWLVILIPLFILFRFIWRRGR